MRHSPALAVARWVARSTGPAILAHLVPRSAVVLLVAVEADAMTPLRGVSRELQALPPWAAGGAAAAAIALGALSERAAVADLLLGRRLALLRRQPLGGPAFGPAAAVVLAPLGWPIAALGLLWSGSPAVALLWLGLWLVPAVSWGRAALVPGLLAAGGLASLAAVVPAAPLAIAVWAAAVPVAGSLALRHALGPEGPPIGLPWRPRTVIGALVRRDLLVAWRADGALVRSALAGALLGVPLAVMHRVARWDGASLASAALVGLAALGLLSLAVPAAVVRRLGRTFDPPAWPVTALERASALAVVGAVVLVPGWASAAVAAPPIGPHGHLRLAAFVAALGAGAAWWIAARPGRPSPGTWAWWIVLCLALDLGAGGLPTLALGALALWRAAAALERRR